jgi:PmbA protein
MSPSLDKETAAAIDLLQDLVGRARKAGADAADAVLFEGTSLSHARRLGKTEKLERSESQDLGLRVLVGKRQAIVSSSDRSPKMLAELVERTLAMARAVPEDPFCGLADPAEIALDWSQLDMLDPEEPSAETLIERARAAEETALAVPGITNSEGAEASWGRSRIALVASNGFAGGYSGSHHGVGASVISGSGTQMERDYDFASAVYAGDLRDADLPLFGCVRSAGRPGLRLASLGRDLRSIDRARHQLSARQAGAADIPGSDHDHRRSAPAARPPLQAVRR